MKLSLQRIGHAKQDTINYWVAGIINYWVAGIGCASKLQRTELHDTRAAWLVVFLVALPHRTAFLIRMVAKNIALALAICFVGMPARFLSHTNSEYK